MDELANFLTDSTIFEFEQLLTPHEWREQDEPGRVSMENMGEILEGIKDEPNKRAKFARFPARFFVYTADLENAFHVTCNKALYDRYEGRCPFHLDWTPSVQPYEDLIGECPDFSPPTPPLSQQESRKQTTAKRNAELNEKAKALRTQHPSKSETWIADKIFSERMKEKPKKDKPESETIRTK